MIEPSPAPESPSGPRRPNSRLAPQAIASRRRDVREGLDWLGHPPSARVSPFFRLVRLAARAVLFGLFRFRIEASGQEHLPVEGGYMLVGAAHRGWMDPFLVLHALPVEPRAWFLGSGPSAFDRRWKEWTLRRLGGMLPVWRGGVGIDRHVESARAVLGEGGVFVLFPEGGVAGTPDRIAEFRVGAALIAIRTGASIVPFAMAGSAELYIGRRMASRILPRTSARELLGESWDGRPPEPGSREELALAHRLTGRLADVLGPPVAELNAVLAHSNASVRPRRLRGLTWLLLSRPRPRR